MKRALGFLASWALLIVALAVCSLAIAAEATNLREVRRFRRFEVVDGLIEAKKNATLGSLRAEKAGRQAGIDSVNTNLANAQASLRDFEDTDQTILVSTAENKVYVRRDRAVIFEAVCSTGKGTTLVDKGRTMVFSTPIGKFRVVSKEENPVWVPPDWHYVEEARKNGLRVVRLERGDSIDAITGNATAPVRETGVWSWLDGEKESPASGSVLKVKGDTIVEITNGVERELPAGQMIRAGDTVVIPPIGVKQRRFDKVLGSHRLNLGDGYALHGTQQTSQLGTSASHGCIRLGDQDIATLYSIANVGDEVVIY
ncbi:MAG TPA: L,D-transpeptidase family protein [Thermoanaerobaculia bacterium]|nr:L,D-transpeptidase family protein [Thermoanaerobaculia bacterium]